MTKETKRFSAKLEAISRIMSRGEWLTLEQIGQEAGMPNWGSVASRLRDLKAYFGWDYEKRSTGRTGFYEYRAWKVDSGQLTLFKAA